MLELKEGSHKLVFSLIRAHGEISGAILSRYTAMQPSSLVYILRHLKSKGLIRLSGYGNSTVKGGKRPLLWEVDPDFGSIIGVEVMRNAIRGVVVNLAGSILLKVEKEFSPGQTEKTIERILRTIQELLDESSLTVKQILYIALAVPGIVHPNDHRIIYSYGLKMENFDLRTHITEKYNTDVGILNDANAGALGEQWFGKTNGRSSNLLYVMYNPVAGGVGLGTIINKELYTGSNGLAGELFSRVPSLQQIIKEGIKETDPNTILLPVNKENYNNQIPEIYFYSKKGCALSLYVLRGLSKLISKEIGRITGLLDPEKIILGGELSICEDFICSEIRKDLGEWIHKSFPFKINVPEVDYARNKIFSPSIGATAMYLSSKLNN